MRRLLWIIDMKRFELSGDGKERFLSPISWVHSRYILSSAVASLIPGCVFVWSTVRSIVIPCVDDGIRFRGRSAKNQSSRVERNYKSENNKRADDKGATKFREIHSGVVCERTLISRGVFFRWTKHTLRERGTRWMRNLFSGMLLNAKYSIMQPYTGIIRKSHPTVEWRNNNQK